MADRRGPRRLLIAGPAISTVGILLLTRIGLHPNYVTDLLPGLLVFAVALAIMVAR